MTAGARHQPPPLGASKERGVYTSRPRPPVAAEPVDPKDPELPLDPDDPPLDPDELELDPDELELPGDEELLLDEAIDEELLLDELLLDDVPLDELLLDALLLDELAIAVGCDGESAHAVNSVPVRAPPDSISRKRRRASSRCRTVSSSLN
ncbi:MAG: hypothetical protein JWL71_3404 [Acidobacteria bacterium]|nr:hypothetical protein [Acidobacteriota bacterium]